jgi:acetyl-CoA carboxylase biotin carboxyl carrier protein
MARELTDAPGPRRSTDPEPLPAAVTGEDVKKRLRMDLKLVQRLMKMMEREGVHELELEDPKAGVKLRLKRAADAPPPQSAPVVHLMHAGAPPAMPATAAAPATAGATPAAAPAPVQGTTIPSPMVGTFYRSPSPDAEPFVGVGSKISVDQTLCIIEAMKVMNEIRAEIGGEILQVLVENGSPVEFGQPLFLVNPL